MKENIEKAIAWIKEQPIKGCITGSSLIGYFEGENQDVDLFAYDEKSFTKILFAMYHNNLFQIIDPIEKWKFEQYINKNQDNFYKFGLVTIKFTYNTCIPVNIILKKKSTDIFSVLSTFDMNIIAKGYDIETKQMLDLSGIEEDCKTVSWNTWNTSYYSNEVWEISRILRQLERCFKYHKRGYNTDAVVHKYIDLISIIQKQDDIFSSSNYSEKLELKKKNTKVIKKLCELWLKTHEISPEQREVLKEKIKEI